MACAACCVGRSLVLGQSVPSNQAFGRRNSNGFGPSSISFPFDQLCKGISSSHVTCARNNWFSRPSNLLRFDRFKSFSSNGIDDAKASDERVTVLVIGGGGREHALCYALKRSSSCDGVFCAPGNAGIARSGDATCITDLDISDSTAVATFCHKWDVGLVVVGPEAPLVAGLANELSKAGVPTFGPSSEAAALEGSKGFMKNLCDKYGIPTAKYQTFTNPDEAKAYVKNKVLLLLSRLMG